ncbi:hypothetical protein C8F04DRAFT_530881 [Mycena alexandri]|uniref:Uncharacterized protein n=1 Tax=Mycena alexandri TaxID=1745969 RepID=A0AAD6SWS3_9AGAR|nr:hypothetical protein C8F04DRAFT_530881 [Mycena alexandri]
MRFALLSLFVSAVVCFTVPTNQPAGVYMVTYNADGTETHSLLSLTETNVTVPAATARSVSPSAKFGASKRQIGGGTNAIFCGGYELNHGDTDAAYNALGQQCGGGASVLGGRDFYSIAGCTVAYFCNYRGTADTCFQYEWVNVIQNAITPTCGSYWAGWDQFNSQARQNQYGYENLCGAGNNYCGRGTNGR